VSGELRLPFHIGSRPQSDLNHKKRISEILGEKEHIDLPDTGERMIPTKAGEVSFVFSRHLFAYRYARQFVNDKEVLDAGTGTGYGASLLGETAKNVLGIDHSAEAIAYSTTHYSAPNVRYTRANIEDLSFDSQFDVAVSFQVIEHLKDPSDFLTRLRRAVRPGGLILITTPNVKHKANHGTENPFHVNEMRYDQLNELLKKHFTSFQLLGIVHGKANPVVRFLRALPIYGLGRRLKRTSLLKKAANQILDLTTFQVIDRDVARKGVDLLVICRNIPVS
jgi:2-polyprenyl-3-methyl-5-hydroxy-6-metoxy-1,4-benzoquinol methylase